MLVYVLLFSDRHTDVEPYLFTKLDTAIGFARQTARECSYDGEIEESAVEGWLYHVSWSPEGDSAWIVAKTLDEEA